MRRCAAIRLVPPGALSRDAEPLNKGLDTVDQANYQTKLKADVSTEEAPLAGLFFDELRVGQTFKHEIRRTITEADNVWFSAITHNPAYLHLDEEYCRTETEFGQRLVNSAFTLALMVGISVGETTLGTAIANLGWDEVRFPKPLFHGDTVRVETEVLELRESRSRPDAGIVTFQHRAYNQHGDLVATCRRSGLQRKKGPAA
jgi:acyl dehydratase